MSQDPVEAQIETAVNEGSNGFIQTLKFTIKDSVTVSVVGGGEVTAMFSTYNREDNESKILIRYKDVDYPARYVWTNKNIINTQSPSRFVFLTKTEEWEFVIEENISLVFTLVVKDESVVMDSCKMIVYYQVVNISSQ